MPFALNMYYCTIIIIIIIIIITTTTTIKILPYSGACYTANA